MGFLDAALSAEVPGESASEPSPGAVLLDAIHIIATRTHARSILAHHSILLEFIAASCWSSYWKILTRVWLRYLEFRFDLMLGPVSILGTPRRGSVCSTSTWLSRQYAANSSDCIGLERLNLLTLEDFI